MFGRLGRGHSERGLFSGAGYRKVLAKKRMIVIAMYLHFSVGAFLELED
jgi:hypothetical protein